MSETGKPMDDGQWIDYGLYGRFTSEAVGVSGVPAAIITVYIAKHNIVKVLSFGPDKCGVSLKGQPKPTVLFATAERVAEWAYDAGG